MNTKFDIGDTLFYQDSINNELREAGIVDEIKINEHDIFYYLKTNEEELTKSSRNIFNENKLFRIKKDK